MRGLIANIASRFEGTTSGCYNSFVPYALSESAALFVLPPAQQQRTAGRPAAAPAICGTRSGQVAQVVERSPEKAGVGGSTPSLATIIPKNLAEIWQQETGKITHGRSPTPTG